MSEESVAALQQQLIDTLKKNGTLTSATVEQAFRSVPRHLFLPSEPLERAYSDIAIAVKRTEEGEWTSSSSQPAIMAIMLEQLDLRPGMRVLEIGAGTGFNAALMAYLVGREGQVTTIDIQPDLIEAARAHLETAGYGWVEAVAGDGGYGYPANAPYDRMILTASSAVIAPAWREQLVRGGRLVLPFNTGGPQISVAFERRGDELASISLSDCGFMPLQGAFSGAQPVHTQIGPDPRLSSISAQPLPCDALQLTEWLSGYHADPLAVPAVASGVQITEREAWALFTWLAVHQTPWAQIAAEGDLAAENQIPMLVYLDLGSERRTVITAMIAAADGAAMLSLPPGQESRFMDSSVELHSNGQPFELYIRPFGNGEQPSQRMLEMLKAWSQAGKPTSARLHFRILPENTIYQPEPGEIVVERPWTKIIIRYA